MQLNLKRLFECLQVSKSFQTSKLRATQNLIKNYIITTVSPSNNVFREFRKSCEKLNFPTNFIKFVSWQLVNKKKVERNCSKPSIFHAVKSHPQNKRRVVSLLTRFANIHVSQHSNPHFLWAVFLFCLHRFSCNVMQFWKDWKKKKRLKLILELNHSFDGLSWYDGVAFESRRISNCDDLLPTRAPYKGTSQNIVEQWR